MSVLRQPSSWEVAPRPRGDTGLTLPVVQPSCRILVADDVAVNQLILLTLLNRLGYAADVVGDGLQVLRAMQGVTYDLILMDLPKIWV
ncbi:response regulator [Prochlorothrix hollandica]|uniref:Response regulatory domain-containing protein n=1 Tax=Prochlorothrix hollandica PCC 9006 = CALU 1027 TaxID=317619 RepID=A0A0M2PVS3_PROHO|nr:response regulator [Prochlorothrix hollandica]KKJ00265.1 hypothetical protein PROH_11290 [Prochlorothrix hollandica PCC 9006 = CALU 1027]